VNNGGHLVSSRGQYVGPAGHCVSRGGQRVSSTGQNVAVPVLGHSVGLAEQRVGSGGQTVRRGGHCVSLGGHTVATGGQNVGIRGDIVAPAIGLGFSLPRPLMACDPLSVADGWKSPRAMASVRPYSGESAGSLPARASVPRIMKQAKKAIAQLPVLSWLHQFIAVFASLKLIEGNFSSASP